MVAEKDPGSNDGQGERKGKMIVEITCPNCNFTKKVPREKIPQGVRWATCPRCKQRFEFSVPGPESGFEEPQGEKSVPPGAGRGPSPWEMRSELGTGRAIVQTMRAVLFSPTSFFRGLETGGGIKEPLAFGLLTGSLGTMLEVFWQFLIKGGSLAAVGQGLFGPLSMSVIFVIAMVLCPLFVAIAMFVASAIVHVLLLIVRGGRNGFGATFSVVAYSQAAQVWSFIPFIGGFIGGIWLIVVQIIGLREIHEISYLRVILALLIPLAFVIAVFIAVIVPLIILR